MTLYYSLKLAVICFLMGNVSLIRIYLSSTLLWDWCSILDMCFTVYVSYCRGPDITLGTMRWFSYFTPACYFSFPHGQADDKERNAADSGELWSGGSEGDRGWFTLCVCVCFYVCVWVCVSSRVRHMADVPMEPQRNILESPGTDEGQRDAKNSYSSGHVAAVLVINKKRVQIQDHWTHTVARQHCDGLQSVTGAFTHAQLRIITAQQRSAWKTFTDHNTIVKLTMWHSAAVMLHFSLKRHVTAE